MPKTKVQSIVFTALMVFCMVYCMTVYTVSMKLGSLSYAVLAMALKEMWVEYLIVFLLIFFIIAKLAMKLMRKMINPEGLPPIVPILTIQCLTVCLSFPALHCLPPFITVDYIPVGCPNGFSWPRCASPPPCAFRYSLLGRLSGWCSGHCSAADAQYRSFCCNHVVIACVPAHKMGVDKHSKMALRMRFVIRRHSHYVILFSA